MFKQELINLKNKTLNLAKQINTIDQDRDIKLIQDIDIKCGGKVFVINNQSLNINVTNNLIEMVQDLENLIGYFDGEYAPLDNILEGFFSYLLDAGVGLQEFKKQISYEYLKFAIEKEGSISGAAKKIGENRSTLSMFKKRMVKKNNDAREKELCGAEESDINTLQLSG